MNLRKYLPTDGEQGRYRGPLSTFAEYHGVAVGFLFYLTDPGLLGPILGYGVGRGSARGGEDSKPMSGHARDAGKELGYVAVGVALAITVQTLGWA